MINRGILFFLTLTIGIGGIAYFLPSRSNNVETTVLIKDTGFEPENIVVERGTKIIFKNAGSQLHWPASNFHPTHTLYPEQGGCLGSTFDTCRGLEHGETFEYVINHVGEWPLHDHLFPGFVMVVKAVDKLENSDSDKPKELPPATDLKQFNYSD